MPASDDRKALLGQPSTKRLHPANWQSKRLAMLDDEGAYGVLLNRVNTRL
jgi:hypothetical protein